MLMESSPEFVADEAESLLSHVHNFIAWDRLHLNIYNWWRLGHERCILSQHCGSRFKICLSRMKTKYRLNEDGCRALIEGGWVKWVCTPNSVIQPLQKIQNFAARLVLSAPRRQHSTPFLEEKKMHWLPISERIKYKFASMWFNAINGSGSA